MAIFKLWTAAIHVKCKGYQAIPGESPNTIPTNTCVVRSNGERTGQLMFYVAGGFMEKFSVVS